MYKYFSYRALFFRIQLSNASNQFFPTGLHMRHSIRKDENEEIHYQKEWFPQI